MVTFFPCPHESGQVDWDQECPDYHPLNWDEILELLEMSLTDQCPQNRYRFQVRLEQGIRGMTCPRPDLDRPLADVTTELDRLYAELMRQERQLDPSLVDQLDKLLNY